MDSTKRLKPIVRCLSTNKKQSRQLKQKQAKENNSTYQGATFDGSKTAIFSESQKFKSAKKNSTTLYPQEYSLDGVPIQPSTVPPDSARLVDPILLQELKSTKKCLIELQARNAANAKEIARLQHELNLMSIKHVSLKVFRAIAN